MAGPFDELPRVASPPGSTTFFLVRHAETDRNAGGVLEQEHGAPLTAAGHAQADALVAAFRETHIDAVYSSDAARARDTVAALAASRGLAVRTSPLLREPSPGRRATTFADPEAAATLLADVDPSAAVASEPRECHADVVARLRRLLDDCERSLRGRTLVVCSHYVTLNTLARMLLQPGDPPAAVWTHFDNASISRIDVRGAWHGAAGICAFLNWSPAAVDPRE